MPSAGPTETELKLQVAAKHIGRLKRSPALSNAASTEVDVDNVYFDTSDRLLQRYKMALRVRQIGGRWLQTLKAEGERSGALSRRDEWETPARVLRGRGRVDLKRLSGSPLPELLARQQGLVALQPVFRTRFRRTQWTVERAGAVVEVALDVGEISTEAERNVLREPICEVELELKRNGHQNGPAALIDLALELLDIRGKQPPTVTPVARSKAERGYQLATRRPATAVKASAKTLGKNVTRKATTARALRAVVANGLAVLTANVERLLSYNDPEYVHQSRVALRRVRSAIRLFDRQHRDMPRSLTDELRWFARTLGEARDWDVIADETVPALAAGMSANVSRQLVTQADRVRRRIRLGVKKAASSPRYAALVLRSERWCLTDAPIRGESLTDAAAPALRKAAKKLFNTARFFSALTLDQKHEVRILAKRLRYALDVFAVALPKHTTARYVEALAELQDVLGWLNDAAIAKAVVPQLTRSARTRKSARLQLAAADQARMRDVETKLLNLSKLESPWA